jgi:hypothetical protein
MPQALAILAFAAFVVAAILKLVNQHANAVTWIIIIGGLLLAAAVIWSRYYYGTRRAATGP